MTEELLVIGGGPAGLAAAAAGRTLGFNPLILEQDSVYGGVWAKVPGDLRCLSFREHDLMPDCSASRGEGDHAMASEILAAINAFTEKAHFRTKFQTRVTGLALNDSSLQITTTTGEFLARRLVVATGEFDRPFTPQLPGKFSGTIEHTRVFDATTCRPGERVIVVGTGNSAIDAVARLQRTGATVMVANRSEIVKPRWGPPARSLLGKLKFALSAMPISKLPFRGGCTHQTPPHDSILFESVASGAITALGEAVGFWEHGLVVAGGRQVTCDRIVMATGYRRNNAWLSPPLSLDEAAVPLHDAGVSTECDRIGFVGIPCMRTRRSGFLRGFVGDAQSVVRRLK